MKKIYMKPATQIVKVEIEHRLLAGSDGTAIKDVNAPSGEYGLSRGSGRFWDEEDDE